MALMCAVVSQFPITMDHLQKIGAMGISVFYSLVPPPPNHLLNRRPWTQVIALQDCKRAYKDISVSNIVAAKVTKEADYVQRSKKEATQHPFVLEEDEALQGNQWVF
ncbi:hypothetical protein SDJN02_10591, partial [Cucurbita argyrosperma subsp. argyrosperma]